MQCTHDCDCNISCIDQVPIFAGLSHEEKLEIAEIASTQFRKG